MSTLEGKNISETFQTLLKTSADTGINSTIGTIEDGQGVKTSLSLGTDSAAIKNGYFGIGIEIPTTQLHIVSNVSQPVLVEDGVGHDQFYIGDTLSNFNVKMGDITGSSSGNDTSLYVKDSSSSIIAKATNVGINNDTPSHSLHVGSNSGTVKFSLASNTSAFDVNNLFTVDTTNNKVTVDGSLEVTGHIYESPNRYILKEYYNRLPGINSSIGVTKNLDFEITGTNTTDSEAAFVDPSIYIGSGIFLETAGALGDDVILQPHTDTNQTAWNNVGFGTENQIEWECSILSTSYLNFGFMAGLKLTNAWDYSTDADQAYFYFGSNDTVKGATNTLNDNNHLHFIYSVGGTDYITNLNIDWNTNDLFRLKISIDANRQIIIYVNEIQYGLVTTATAGGALASSSTTKSNALTNDVDLKPYIGIAPTTGASVASVIVSYQKISRLVTE
jgi:hypothetical protein